MIDYNSFPSIDEYVMNSNHRVSKHTMLIILILLIFALIFIALIPFNAKISSNLKIISENPIVNITSRTNGNLITENLFNGDTIYKNEFIGYIDSDDAYESILKLERAILNDSLKINNVEKIDSTFFTTSTIDEQLKLSFIEFTERYVNYVMLSNLDHEKSLKLVIESSIRGDRKNIDSKEQELKNSKISDENAKNLIDRQRHLYEKGIISKKELELKEREYSGNTQSTIKIQSEITSLKNELSNSKSVKNKIEEEYLKSLSKNYIQLSIAKKILLSEIANWKHKNIIISPITGRLMFYNFENSLGNTKTGDTICSIIPLNTNSLIAKTKIPVHNSSKVRPNLSVLVKLDNYPSNEFGSLKGTVKTKSEIISYGGQIGYLTIIKLNKHKTTYGKEILVLPDMMGTAEIILEKTSLMERIFYQFKSVWLNK